MMFLITPPNGLLSQYLYNNAIVFESQNKDAGPLPLTYKLTVDVLGLLKHLFKMPEKFTKYVFIEELVLFYMRTHYISFIRLYNKSFSKKAKHKGS